MGRPRKILSDEQINTISTDLEFAKQMIKTRNLTARDLAAAIRHIDMARNDLVVAINARQK